MIKSEASASSQAFARSLFHCSIRKCPEVGESLRRFGRIHHALGEEDAEHSLCGIGVGRCAEAAVPTESARCVRVLLALNGLEPRLRQTRSTHFRSSGLSTSAAPPSKNPYTNNPLQTSP